MTIRHYEGKAYTYEGLFSESGPELKRLHNALAPKFGVEPTKRFSDKVSAAKRTWALLGKLEEVTKEPEVEAPKAAAKQAAAPKAPKEKKAPKEASERKLRGYHFVWKPLDFKTKGVREGTNRATLLKLLTREKGATFAECLAATWGSKNWSEKKKVKTCYEAVRLLHSYTGYGSRKLDDGPNPHFQFYANPKYEE